VQSADRRNAGSKQISDLRELNAVYLFLPSGKMEVREDYREIIFDSNRIRLTTVTRENSYFTSPFLKLSCLLNSYMAQNQQQGGALPSSQGGLVQYFDADTGFEIDPKTVVMAGGLIAALEIVLGMGVLPI
jgi:preprotein translocase subunit Sec61beta